MDNDHTDKLKKNTVEIAKVLNALYNETRLSVLSLLLDVDLSDITSRYNELYLLLKKCHEEFPLGLGEMPTNKCEKVAGLLREGKKIESEALVRIKEVLTIL